MRDSLHKLEGLGFHVFRGFRVTHLREQETPEDILRFWIGHADKSIADRNCKMSERIKTRKEWAERAGLDLNLPAFCAHCTKKAALALHENAA